LAERFAQRVAISTKRVFHHPRFGWLEQVIRSEAGANRTQLLGTTHRAAPHRRTPIGQ
jgi:hypothetical protein